MTNEEQRCVPEMPIEENCDWFLIPSLISSGVDLLVSSLSLSIWSTLTNKQLSDINKGSKIHSISLLIWSDRPRAIRKEITDTVDMHHCWPTVNSPPDASNDHLRLKTVRAVTRRRCRRVDLMFGRIPSPSPNCWYRKQLALLLLVSLERQFDTNGVQTTFFLLIQQIDQRKPVLVGLIARILSPPPPPPFCIPSQGEENRHDGTTSTTSDITFHIERTNEPTAVS